MWIRAEDGALINLSLATDILIDKDFAVSAVFCPYGNVPGIFSMSSIKTHANPSQARETLAILWNRLKPGLGAALDLYQPLDDVKTVE